MATQDYNLFSNNGGQDWHVMQMARSVCPNVDWGGYVQGTSGGTDTRTGANSQAMFDVPHTNGRNQAGSEGPHTSGSTQAPRSDGAREQQKPVGGVSVGPDDFPTWLRRQGMTDPTIRALVNEGFTDQRLLCNMEEEDVADMDIPTLAQKRLLLKLVKQLAVGQAGNGQQSTTERMHTSDPLGDVSQKLANLLGSLPPAVGCDPPRQPATNNTATGERIDLNPLSYLLPQQKAKYLDIIEYVQSTRYEAAEEEQVLGGGEGHQIILKTSTRKVKLEQVSPMQWSAANVRVLMELLRQGRLRESAMFDYLAYTIKVSELADRYTWVSVLHFDRAYRQLQAQHGFRWGSDSPHLGTLHLQPRTQTPRHDTTPAGTKAQGSQQGKKPCRLYNRNNCPFGDACKFEHKCSAPSCGGKHPLALHGKDTPGQAPKNPPRQE